MMALFSNERTINIAPQTIVFTVSLLLGLYFVYFIRDIILLLLMAFIIMVGLRPLSRFFQTRLRFKKPLAIAASYIVFVTCLIVFLAFVLPPVVRELLPLFRLINIPEIENQLKSFSFSLQELNDIAGRVGQSVNVVFQVVNTTFSGLFSLFTLFVISVYLMIERDSLHKKIGWFTNKKEHFKKVEEFLDSIESQLGGWVRGQLILMLVVGLMIYIGLSLLGIPYALPLALIAGLLEIIPNVGPTLSAIPATIIAYMTFGPLIAMVTVLLYVVVQQLENNLLVPKIMSANANVNPLVAIISIIIGIKTAGVAGALLAIPIYIIIRTVYVSFLRRVDLKDIEAAKKA